MYHQKGSSMTEEYLLPPYGNSGNEAARQPRAIGIPKKRHLISRKDLSVLAIELLCLLIGILTVFQQQIASHLGQLYQLIVVGFVLAVMAMTMEDQVTRVVLIYLGYRRHSTLQDFDAMLRKDLTAPQIGFFLRFILLALTALPLGLSVSYKLFVGGSSNIIVERGDGVFGYSALPGYQRIGDGLSLLADIYQPFWIDPAVNRTYGFNLYIASNDTAVVPDTPYPQYLTMLQSELGSGERFLLTVDVNATVSTLANPTADERTSLDYWDNVTAQFGHNATQLGGNQDGANNALWAGMMPPGSQFRSNFSIAFLSAWNTTRNETFFSEAFRCEQRRALCRATWNITSSDARLSSASLIIPNTTASLPDQTIIQNNFLGVQEMFSNFLGEYDWHNRAGAFEFPYPSPVSASSASSPAPPKWTLDVNTVPALSASMVWARATSFNGGDRPTRNPELVVHAEYSRPSSQIAIIKNIPTLQRKPLLVFVLMINPAIALICVFLKLRMHQSPVDDGFNIVALLTAAAGSEIGILKGAGLSGELERRVSVRFLTVPADGENHMDEGREGNRQRILVEFDRSGRRDVLSRDVVYE